MGNSIEFETIEVAGPADGDISTKMLEDNYYRRSFIEDAVRRLYAQTNLSAHDAWLQAIDLWKARPEEY